MGEETTSDAPASAVEKSPPAAGEEAQPLGIGVMIAKACCIVFTLLLIFIMIPIIVPLFVEFSPKDMATVQAEMGDVRAMFNLGLMYREGKDGAEKDLEKSVAWYRKAAEHGHAKAMNNLGVMYGLGDGVTKDPVAGASWIRRSAEAGESTAQFQIGLMAQKGGSGVKKDMQEALIWYSKAADQGNIEAMFTIGTIYDERRKEKKINGKRKHKEVTKDDNSAIDWYRKAAEQKHDKAIMNLAGALWEQDNKEAVEWYQKIVNRGPPTLVARALMALAKIYENGIDTITDKPEWAMKYYQQAIDTGEQSIIPTAEADLRTLKRKYMTEEERKLQDMGFEMVKDGQDKQKPGPESKGPVRQLVKKDFKKTVLDPDKDVLVEFYAPWCGHCQEFEPTYDLLATKLQPVPSLVVAKIDADAHDVSKMVKGADVPGFPSLVLWRASIKSDPVEYPGERSLQAIREWLQEKATYNAFIRELPSWNEGKTDEL